MTKPILFSSLHMHKLILLSDLHAYETDLVKWFKAVTWKNFYSQKIYKKIWTVHKVLARVVEIGNNLYEGMPHYETTLLYSYIKITLTYTPIKH